MDMKSLRNKSSRRRNMAASVLTVVLTSHFRWDFNRKSLSRINMNAISLIAVFTLGIVFTLLVSFLSEHVRNESIRQQSEEAIATRRKIFEKSRALTSIPDESQLTVVDVEFARDLPQRRPQKISFDTNPGKIPYIITNQTF